MQIGMESLPNSTFSTTSVTITGSTFDIGSNGSADPPGVTRAIIIGNAGTTNISDNTIHMRRIAAGIDVSGVFNGTFDDNIINIYSTGGGGLPSSSRGMSISHCTSASISGNNITSNGNPVSFWSHGLDLAHSPSCTIDANFFNSVNIGVAVTGNCTGTFTSNQFNGSQDYGLFYATAAVAPNLGDQTCALNLWKGSFNFLGADASATNDVFIVDINDPNQSTTTNNSNFFDFTLECLVERTQSNKDDQTELEHNLNYFEDFQVYPNPANDYFYINVPTTVDNTSIEITDLAGKLVIREQALKEKSNIRLDISSLNCGVYIVHLLNGQSRFSKKIVVQK